MNIKEAVLYLEQNGVPVKPILGEDGHMYGATVSSKDNPLVVHIPSDLKLIAYSITDKIQTVHITTVEELVDWYLCSM